MSDNQIVNTRIKSGLFRIRPKLTRTSSLPPCQVIDALQEHIVPGGMVVGSALGNNATLKIQKEHRCFWSPVVEIHVVKRAKGSVIKGVMGPDPKIWTVFMLLNILTIILFFIGMLMLIYQWLFGAAFQVVWSLPASIVVAVLVVIFARIGQMKGKEQIKVLWQFVDSSVKEKEKNREEAVSDKNTSEATV